MAFVSVDNVEKTFDLNGGGTYIALKGIDLNIEKGEFISLIGHSGCGKSTLLNMVAGLDLPTEGVVMLQGDRVPIAWWSSKTIRCFLGSPCVRIFGWR
jgi:bicarbonate transport system ATP-binding protein